MFREDHGSDPSDTHTTIVESLLAQAERRPQAIAFTVVADDGEREVLRNGELVARALDAASGLKERGLRRGDRVLICLPTSPEILVVIYGVLLAGGVCVPIYPPSRAAGAARFKRLARAFARVTQPRGAVVSQRQRLHVAAVLEEVGEGLFTATPRELVGRGGGTPTPLSAADLAFVQFTSGTTQQPRGVAISHGALMANIRGLVDVMPLDDTDISVSWLPPYHDMGLVGHIFKPVQCGVHQYLMSPVSFVRQPERWLRLIDEVRATQTTAPNSAYAMCVRRIPPAARAGLDLSCLHHALNGAETVQAHTLERFCEAFGPHGFPTSAFRPVYGLAEATLAATFSAPGEPRVDWVDRQQLARYGRAVPLRRDLGDAQAIVCVGRPLPGHRLTVVDEAGAPRPEREVGQIWFAGPSLCSGYFNNPLATVALRRGEWLVTGDLGYIADGELFVTGREKELIIHGGRNYLPQDVEAACGEVPGLRAGRVVAFGTADLQRGTEQLVVVAEVRSPERVGDRSLAARVAAAVNEQIGLRPERVDLVAAGTLPKTTSGKLQRTRVKQLVAQGRPLIPPRRSLVEVLTGDLRSAVELVTVRTRRFLGWQ